MKNQLKYKIYVHDIPLKVVFSTAHGSRTKIQTVILELAFNDYKGWGEIPIITYYGMEISQIIDELTAFCSSISLATLTEPEHFWQRLTTQGNAHRFILNALDQAYWDIWGKSQRTAVRDLIPLPQGPLPTSSYTITLSTPQQVKQQIEANSWPTYKIKLGGDHDLETLHTLRKLTTHPLRVDINEGWTIMQALTLIPQLSPFDIEFIEQPLARPQITQMKKLKQLSTIPFIADESCHDLQDIDQCIPYFDGINIKLTKCGGITPAIQMIKYAKSMGLKTMIGCMTESTIGISAAAQLLPFIDYADLDGATFLQFDIASGVTVTNGIVAFPSLPGNGSRLLHPENADYPI